MEYTLHIQGLTIVLYLLNLFLTIAPKQGNIRVRSGEHQEKIRERTGLRQEIIRIKTAKFQEMGE